MIFNLVDNICVWKCTLLFFGFILCYCRYLGVFLRLCPKVAVKDPNRRAKPMKKALKAFLNRRFLVRGESMEFDTITAISTPLGEGAIAIVRISGDGAIGIADKIFRGPSGKSLLQVNLLIRFIMAI